MHVPDFISDMFCHNCGLVCKKTSNISKIGPRQSPPFVCASPSSTNQSADLDSSQEGLLSRCSNLATNNRYYNLQHPQQVNHRLQWSKHSIYRPFLCFMSQTFIKSQSKVCKQHGVKLSPFLIRSSSNTYTFLSEQFVLVPALFNATTHAVWITDM